MEFVSVIWPVLGLPLNLLVAHHRVEAKAHWQRLFKLAQTYRESALKDSRKQLPDWQIHPNGFSELGLS